MKNHFLLVVLVSLQLSVPLLSQLNLDKTNQETKILQSNFVKGKVSYLPQNERFKIGGSSGVTDSIIALVVPQINPDSIKYFIQKLQDFQTRYLFANNRFEIANWIKGEFERFGNLEVEFDTFRVDGTLQQNVVATLQGNISPDHYVIIGGHYDSYSHSDPMITSPGADDNASGTAAVLEIARVLSSLNIVPESSIKFITFAAEELMLSRYAGCRDFAQKAIDNGVIIKLMINSDMISHNTLPLELAKAEINYYTGFLHYRDLAINYANQYSSINVIIGMQNQQSDSYPFYERGYPAIYFEENEFSPFYHSPEDTIGNYDMEYCAEVVKGNVAVLIKVSNMPEKVYNLLAQDLGNGNSIKLNWNKNKNIESDVIGYNISIGTSTGVYDTTFFTTDTVSIISGLLEGSEYYFGVLALDINNNESFIVENSIVPNLLPLSPQNFVDFPEWYKVKFTWSENKELDLIGYNLYRSETETQGFIKINQSTIQDTTYTDENIISSKYYYYQLKAVDSDLNESNPSDIIRSRVVSLDRGILLVDETKNGSGILFEPTDEEVDQFYDSILVDFFINDFDIEAEENNIKLADIGAYSTIIWQGNDYLDYTSVLNAKEAIKKYLGYGGNFLYTGFSAKKAFYGNISTIIKFDEGDFIYDYLKIDTSINKITSLFIGASPVTEFYNYINVDSSKSSLATNYHIKRIESISSNSEGKDIYTYNSNYDSTSPQGSMQGLPVGVEYIGNDYKSVILNIPLYYMNQDQAKLLINYILQSKFNELTDVNDEVKEVVPSNFVLYQNYPNPFNPSTKISWQSPVGSWQTLKVFDMLGNEVAILVNEERPAGKYEVVFDASKFASGIYFYQLNAGAYNSTKKLMLLK